MRGAFLPQRLPPVPDHGQTLRNSRPQPSGDAVLENQRRKSPVLLLQARRCGACKGYACVQVASLQVIYYRNLARG